VARYGENSRVLAWIFDRCEGNGSATETPIGKLPGADGIDVRGLNVAPDAMRDCCRSTSRRGPPEVPSIRKHYAAFEDKLPRGLQRARRARVTARSRALTPGRRRPRPRLVTARLVTPAARHARGPSRRQRTAPPPDRHALRPPRVKTPAVETTAQV
jgi:hypothetical protein